MVNLKDKIGMNLCVEAYDLLAEAYQTTWFLPNKGHPDYYKTPIDIFEALEAVARDDTYWRSFPEKLTPQMEPVRKMAGQMSELAENGLTMVVEGKVATPEQAKRIIDGMVDNIEKKVKTRDELRREFFSLLEKVSK